MKDKYDHAIELLKKNPEMISKAWFPWNNADTERKRVHCLFRSLDRVGAIGCLTEIRSGMLQPMKQAEEVRALVSEIREDKRIPKSSAEITVDHLEVFAQWQRKIDAFEKAMKA